MSCGSKQRLVDGPGVEFLDEAEVATYLRMSVQTLRRLVKSGLFPRSLEMSDRIRMWHWSDCYWWQVYVQLRSRLHVSDETVVKGETKPQAAKKAP